MVVAELENNQITIRADRMKRLLNKAIDLFNLFIPNRCVLCSEDLGEQHYVCNSCLSTLTPFRNFSPDFYSLFHFDKKIKRLLYLLKYDYRGEVGVELGKRLGETLKSYIPYNQVLLIPVPLHKEKLYMRGYNQSEMIAKGISEITGWKLRSDLVKRVRFTESQTTFSKFKRKENMSGAFVTVERCDSDTLYFIIDDVVTTGATTSEIKDLLKKNGASRVSIASVAAPNPPEEVDID